MPLRDLLVHLDPSRHCEARVKAAVALAARCEAHLTGLYVSPRLELPPFLSDQFAPAQLDDAFATVAFQRDQTQRIFEAATGAANCEAEWIELTGAAGALVPAQVRHVDMAILGQIDPAEKLHGTDRALPEHVALGTGRPMLMVPYAGEFESIGERILVAWNGSPQAARAVNDALPLLARAAAVTVLEIDPLAPDDTDGTDIGRHLQRHGIRAELVRVPGGGIDIADLLLSRAADASADLIVMGVFGHSRTREIILGGVSRHVLQHMIMPVLMSH
jgi:nucleotide-binding universal stress UspA family protein